MKKNLFLILFIIQTVSFFPEVFKFQFSTDEKSRVECTIEGKQFVNSIFYLSYMQEYKTVSTVKQYRDGVATILESYFYYNKNNLVTSEIRELKENVEVTHLKDAQGRMTANNSDYLPTLRNVPFFLEKEIQVNEKWNAPGYEVQDLFGDKKLSVFPIDVNYTFLGNEEINGKKVSKIYYEYNVDITNSSNYKIDNRILRINGVSK
ncbi:MAG TPA: hypothetical protein PK771_03450, partial [Spirochaetota bacterium]|nr:hypothetical protein [Spirochaetota bacterium]